MPDPLLSSSGKGLVSIRIIAKEKSSVVFLKFCLECHSIVKNRIMFPPGVTRAERCVMKTVRGWIPAFCGLFLCLKEWQPVFPGFTAG